MPSMSDRKWKQAIDGMNYYAAHPDELEKIRRGELVVSRVYGKLPSESSGNKLGDLVERDFVNFSPSEVLARPSSTSVAQSTYKLSEGWCSEKRDNNGKKSGSWGW